MTLEIGFQERNYTGETDLKPLVDLLGRCEVVDQIEDSFSLEELRRDVEMPWLDKERDIRVWEKPDGEIVALAMLFFRPLESELITPYFYFKIDPTERKGFLPKQVLNWAEKRASYVKKEKEVPVGIDAGAREKEEFKQQLLLGQDYRLNRTFYHLKRSLAEPIPRPELPEGYTLRFVKDEKDLEEWVDCYNLSFIDHWNFNPSTLEMRQYRVGNPEYRAEGDLIVVAPNGKIAGFCYCFINRDSNRRNNQSEGWIDLLGTRRGYRQAGLGTALLRAGLHWLKEQGLSYGMLGVDAENPTGALRIYRANGFRDYHTNFSYRKLV